MKNCKECGGKHSSSEHHKYSKMADKMKKPSKKERMEDWRKANDDPSWYWKRPR